MTTAIDSPAARGGWGREIWLPLLFLVLSGAGILILWQVADQTEAQRYALETQITSEQVRLRLEAWIDGRIAVVEHMRDEWPGELVRSPDIFRQEAESFLRLYPGFQALNWIDADWVIRIVVPKDTNEPALDQDLHRHPSSGVVQAITRAIESDQVTITPVIDLLQGGRGFAVYRPLRDDEGNLAGFINGVFRVATLVDACLAEPRLRERFRYELQDENGQLAYEHHADSQPLAWPHQIRSFVRVVDRPWLLTIAPSATRMQLAKNTAGDLLVIAGLVLALILSLLLYAFLRRQRALRDSQAKYRLLVNNQTDMIVNMDPQGKLLFTSPSYCETFGMNEDQLLGHDFIPLVHEDDREAMVQAMAELQRPPHTAYVEERAMTKDGWRWQAWSNTAVLDDDGRITAIVGVGRDITARKNLEWQLLQSQKMQAVGHLAGGVAHDFNNILQAILGNLDLAMLDLEDKDNLREDLEQVRQGAERAADLTKQLLAFSRQQVINPHDLDLNDAIADAVKMLGRVIGEHVELEFHPGHDPGVVHADPRQIEQVLMNLCVNARDAIQGEGRISITTATATLDDDFCALNAWARPGRYALFEVMDTGAGMDADTLSMIFEPFFTTKQVGQGTGLGLAMVYGIVKQHNGLIDVQSEPGQGTRIRIYLSRVDRTAVLPAGKDRAEANGGVETILVAEDDRMVRDVAARILQNAGYNVLSAADGTEAVQIFEEHGDEIALALLDVVMPGLGGREVHDLIKSNQPDIRVLFTSGYSGNAIHTRFVLDAGMELMPKPYEREDLLRKVRELLDA